MKEIIFLNGRCIRKKEAVISACGPGAFYGCGVFETMRSYRQRVVYLKNHLLRIGSACRRMGIAQPFRPQELTRMIAQAVKLSGFRDAYVRLSIYEAERGVDTVVLVKKYTPYTVSAYRRGFRACIAGVRQNESSVLPGIKSINRLLYRIAYGQAQRDGFDEAIMLNSRGLVAEGSRTNIFLVKSKKILTPALESGCLNGITRQAVCDLAGKCGFLVKQGAIAPRDVRKADEAFLTNSLVGIMPLVSLAKSPINRGKAGSVTMALMQQYKLLLKGGGQ